MLNVYFFNSYQNSYVGYQLARYMVGTDELEIVADKKSMAPEAESILMNGGTTCVLGRNQNGMTYFGLCGLEIADGESRGWFINMALEADQDSASVLLDMVSKIFMDYGKFLDELGGWFYVTPEEKLSFQMNTSVVEQYIRSPQDKSINDIDFYQGENSHIKKYRDMVSGLGTEIGEGIYLLVPETTKQYFYKQNPHFENMASRYLFESKVFKNILEKNQEVLVSQESEEAEKKGQGDGTKNIPINSTDWNGGDDEETVISGKMILVAVLVVVIIGIAALKKMIFRR